MSGRIIKFGTFELHPERGQLLNDGVRVGLGSRALAILTLLVERAGQVVTVQELTERVWPNVFVQENNLRVHLTSIRRTLRASDQGAVEIANIPGRGYRFQGDVTESLSAGAVTADPLNPTPLPLQVNRLIGREDVLQDVTEKLQRHRLVTLVGAGGIGKTTAALASLTHLRDATGQRTCFVDLTNCKTMEHVVSATAAALQSPFGLDGNVSTLLSLLNDASLILMIDNCEHIVGVAARYAETVLLSCPDIRLLATSREPLRVASEVQVHLKPLAVPAIEENYRVEEVLTNPSALLFTERAQAASSGFGITIENAGQVAVICRSLEGLPLALELAAAAMPVVGLDALTNGLVERLSALPFGRRTIARHETLEAMLDWSFELLSPLERVIFGRLSLFRSSFDLSAALRVATGRNENEVACAQGVLQLAAKSLLVIEPSRTSMSYRLLETTKSYASRKLQLLSKDEYTPRRHAEWVGEKLHQAKADWTILERSAWWERYGHNVDDVRAALDWTFSSTGDGRLGVDLTIASAPLWLGMSLFAEFRDRLDQALNHLEELGLKGGLEEIQLQTSLFVLLFNAEGPGEGLVKAASRALEIAERIGDVAARNTALWALAGERSVMGDYETAEALAVRMADPKFVIPGGETHPFAQRLIALKWFRQGQLLRSTELSAQIVREAEAETSYGTAIRYDHSTVARANHSVSLALLGKLDTAKSMMMEAVVDARRVRNPSSFCYILSNAACPLALWLGDGDLARHYIDLLTQTATQNRFIYMLDLARSYRAVSDLKIKTDATRNDPALNKIQLRFPHDKDLFVTIHPYLCDHEALHRITERPRNWATAEIIRSYGERHLDVIGSSAAMDLFLQALSIAEEQGAALWALRAATSLARLAPPSEVEGLLTPALASIEFEEQHEDVRTALSLLS